MPTIEKANLSEVSTLMKDLMRKMDVADGKNDGLIHRESAKGVIKTALADAKKNGPAFAVPMLEMSDQMLKSPKVKDVLARLSEAEIDSLISSVGKDLERVNMPQRQRAVKDTAQPAAAEKHSHEPIRLESKSMPAGCTTFDVPCHVGKAAQAVRELF